MIKSLILPLVGVVAFVAVVGFFVNKSSVSSLSQSQNLQTITINDTEIKAEIVKTETEREKGLSGRTNLSQNSGMFFIFDTKNVKPVFWMKGMLIPLDFIWISDNKIVQIDKNVQPPDQNTPDNKLSTYSPSQPVDYILEVNAGFSDTNKIEVGNVVQMQLK